ncbi:MAG TPA: DMT family protein [Fimbriimonadaceae bacterium]|jgi:hypothetical protein
MKKILITISLLLCSNVFMNFAWYGHLRFKDKPLVLVIFASWGLALLEYCFQVPANRIGNDVLTVVQLKVVQEVITLSTFAVIAAVVFKERLTMNQGIAFLLLVAAAYFAVKK